jgi:hypothetical protein
MLWKIFFSSLGDYLLYKLDKDKLNDISENLLNQDVIEHNKYLGNIYEKEIGELLEYIPNSLVIYHGFLKGYKDRGVDLVLLTKVKGFKFCFLIQCKNWKKKEIGIEEIENIYKKLIHHNKKVFFDFYPSEINHFLKFKKDKRFIQKFINSFLFSDTKIVYEKVLLIPSSSILKDEVDLQNIDTNILKYKDLFISVCTTSYMNNCNIYKITNYEIQKIYRKKYLDDIADLIENLE